MAQPAFDDLDLVLKTMATTIVDNADEFAQLDAVVGDGDFGYSLRNGFEVVAAEYDTFDRTSIGSILKKIGFVISAKVGGVSGPIWGTAFLRAAAAVGDRTELSTDEIIAMLRASVEGIMARGQSSLGDKTLLDALVPAIDSLEESFREPIDDHGVAALDKAAQVAVKAAADTKGMLAMRGRAAYTGDRSRDSVDAGATAIGVILTDISAAWRARHSQS